MQACDAVPKPMQSSNHKNAVKYGHDKMKCFTVNKALHTTLHGITKLNAPLKIEDVSALECVLKKNTSTWQTMWHMRGSSIDSSCIIMQKQEMQLLEWSHFNQQCCLQCSL